MLVTRKPPFDRTYQDKLQADRERKMAAEGRSEFTIFADRKIYERELAQAKAIHDAMSDEQYTDRECEAVHYRTWGCD